MITGCDVIVALDDVFSRLYVVSALEHAGANIIGPVGTVDEIRALMQSSVPRAVILSSTLAAGAAGELADELRERGIAQLVLAEASGQDDWSATEISVLRTPFAAYQVVQWLAQVPSPAWAPTGRDGDDPQAILQIPKTH